MEWIGPVVGAVLGFLGTAVTGELFSHARRQTKAVNALIETRDRLPEGKARERLDEHVDRQVQLLIAATEGYTPGERLWRYLGGAMCLTGLTMLLVRAGRPTADPSAFLYISDGAVSASWWVYGVGLCIWMVATLPRAIRAQVRFHRADTPPPTPAE